MRSVWLIVTKLSTLSACQSAEGVAATDSKAFTYLKKNPFRFEAKPKFI